MSQRLKRDLHYLLIIIGLVLLLGVSFKKQIFMAHFSPAYDADAENYNWETTDFITNLDVPWDMVFNAGGDLFITERPGTVKMRTASGEVKTIATLDQVAAVGESGLTGLALHPQFELNGYMYLYYTYRQSGDILNRVSRFTYKNSTLSDEVYIVNNLPGGSIHNGGRLAFGPDKKLWILTGDAARGQLAQDKNSLAGKVLRINDDGSIPSDNPFGNSAIYSLGHRNPQGLAWHPLTEELVVSSHGETAHDELNLVKSGTNHGWPLDKKCVSSQAEFTDPILCSQQETWAPSGITFYGTTIWRLRNSLFFAGLRSGLLERVEIIDSKIGARETILKGNYGRLRAVVVGPDGALYVSTSNKDGRGQPKAGDDRILKITPKIKE